MFTTEPCATDQDAPANEIEQARYGDNCLDPIAITLDPICHPSCYTHDDSLLWKGDDCQSPSADILSRSSIACVDSPPAFCYPECSTVLATQPALLSIRGRRSTWVPGYSSSFIITRLDNSVTATRQCITIYI